MLWFFFPVFSWRQPKMINSKVAKANSPIYLHMHVWQGLYHHVSYHLELCEFFMCVHVWLLSTVLVLVQENPTSVLTHLSFNCNIWLFHGSDLGGTKTHVSQSSGERETKEALFYKSDVAIWIFWSCTYDPR